jgi:hypothetical protein
VASAKGIQYFVLGLLVRQPVLGSNKKRFVENLGGSICLIQVSLARLSQLLLSFKAAWNEKLGTVFLAN